MGEELEKPEVPQTIDSWRKEMLLNIVDKQYSLYSWSDAKTASLITANSILLAVIGFIHASCLEDLFSLLCEFVALILVGLSLYFSLKQVIPQRSSGKAVSERQNIRSLSGILSFGKWEEYFDATRKIAENEYMEDNARQVFGMAHNVEKSRTITTRGIYLTIWGILFIVLSIIGTALSAKGVHLLGIW